jgi:hypothetical protein
MHNSFCEGIIVCTWSFWQGIDRSDQPSFPPHRFPTNTNLSGRKSRQKRKRMMGWIKNGPVMKTPSRQNKLFSF